MDSTTDPAAPMTQRPTRRRDRMLIAGAAVLVAAVTGSLVAFTYGGDGEAQAPTTRTLTGTMTLDAGSDFEDWWPMGSGCAGGGGYSDIRAGAPVVVYDGAGGIVASGSLDEGSPTQSVRDARLSATMDRVATRARGGTAGVPGFFDRGSQCTFGFTVGKVPTSAEFYQVEVSQRGRITHSRTDLDAAGWTVDLTLGD